MSNRLGKTGAFSELMAIRSGDKLDPNEVFLVKIRCLNPPFVSVRRWPMH
ncbi:hypothetical protein QOZ95_004528 [Paenibacillus brasilensis]|uniref:Uncharacterized protein n=1 Tax=Paenibacillus brasilensis TaxID=128574 RepID=A0ABU0L4V8_9BACL|nr:hypothetical protein [Paenibacillus brasilensis]